MYAWLDSCVGSSSENIENRTETARHMHYSSWATLTYARRILLFFLPSSLHPLYTTGNSPGKLVSSPWQWHVRRPPHLDRNFTPPFSTSFSHRHLILQLVRDRFHVEFTHAGWGDSFFHNQCDLEKHSMSLTTDVLF